MSGRRSGDRPGGSTIRARAALIACLSAGIAGCAGLPSPPVVVKVAVPVPCRVEVPTRPALPVDSLAPGGGLFEQVQALIVSVVRLEAHADRVEAALDGCRGGEPGDSTRSSTFQ
jgi:hypothetical protein